MNVYICDTNPEHLVPASTLTDAFFQVPSVFDEGYYSYMLNLLIKEDIDIYVPLIDHDLLCFSQDNPDLIKNEIYSLAPNKAVAELVTDKKLMNEFLASIGINVPALFLKNEIESNKEYFVKPRRGFGSRGAKILTGSEILVTDDIICQQLCTRPELTVEVYCTDKNLISLCRERIAMREGVSTKAKCFYDDEIHSMIIKIAQNVTLPLASCIQFMKDSNNEWSLIDLNLRIGAGTALSAAIDFEIVRAVLYKILNDHEMIDFLKIPSEPRYVVRVFNEVVTL